MRVFIAISIPYNHRSSLRRLQAGIKGARWVMCENFHVTLRFLGEVAPKEVEDLLFSLSAIALPSFSINVSGVGYFSRKGKVRSVWASVCSSKQLLRLQKKVENICIRSGFCPGARKFKPHVTIGRLKGVRLHDIEYWLKIQNDFGIGSIDVKKFTLFESRLGSEDPHYVPLEDYLLS